MQGYKLMYTQSHEKQIHSYKILVPQIDKKIYTHIHRFIHKHNNTHIHIRKYWHKNLHSHIQTNRKNIYIYTYTHTFILAHTLLHNTHALLHIHSHLYAHDRVQEIEHFWCLFNNKHPLLHIKLTSDNGFLIVSNWGSWETSQRFWIMKQKWGNKHKKHADSCLKHWSGHKIMTSVIRVKSQR